ncbi:MAG: head-tail adaptor protein [Deltaproteobacteria bacterium]|nr:MAG: head-tail adaptor protein [Deltaproteobacteria bacterium]
MGTKAGQLDRRIRLQRLSTAKNSFGEDTPTYIDEATVWARLLPLPGKEEFVPSDGHSARQPVLFEIRYRSGIGPKWRVVYDGAEYDVEDVGEIGRREGLRLVCFARNVISGTS